MYAELIVAIAMLCQVNGYQEWQILECQKYYINCISNSESPKTIYLGDYANLLKTCVLKKEHLVGSK